MPIEVHNVFKRVGQPENQILTDISLKIDDGEFVSLTGRSGSGKSTLLYILSSLDRPSSGEVTADGVNFLKMNEDELGTFRNQKIGFVFQFHYLISELSVIENVLLPAKKMGHEEKWRAHAEALITQVGLTDKMNRLPRQLSGGEQQRVAIARALVMKPRYLFADEPTGSLDSVNGQAVMKMLCDANRDLHTTLILVTHDRDFAAMAHRQVHLSDGQVVKS